MVRKTIVVKELRRIANLHHGVLNPKTVVNIARNEDSVLHSLFEWDNTIAGEQWRLEQARGIIRITFETISPSIVPQRVFVSLSTCRNKKGGYFLTENVLKDKHLRNIMLQDALNEFSFFEQKYKRLNELNKVFAEASKVKKKYKK